MKNNKKSRYIRVEESRNRRLWITEVLLPITSIATTALAIPEVRNGVGTAVNWTKSKCNNLKDKVKNHKKKNFKVIND